jgi:O-antigen/teichoic acid export membrane protein
MNDLKNTTIKGLFWSSVDKFAGQGISFVLQLILARILTPDDYGVVGMLAIFLAISQTFIDSGFTNALIRKHNRNETDFSTVFFFNIGMSVFFYLILFFASPLIADFYHKPILEQMTKVLGLVLIINSFASIQRTRLTIALDFKTQTKIGLSSIVISGVVGIVLAKQGWGAWALVAQSIIYAVLSAGMFWIITKWMPKLVFSWNSFRSMFSFGSKLLLSALIDTTYQNIYGVVIGKKFSAGDLGLYSRANQFAQFPSVNLTGVVGRVTYPILSTLQHEPERLPRIYRQYLRFSAFLVFPLMMGLAALAYPTIKVILGNQWLACVVWLQILCFSTMWYPIHAINLNLLQVKGRSDLFLRLEIIKKILGVTILIITLPIGITAMCIGGIASSLIALVINTYYTGKLIDVGFVKQMKDLLPSLVYSVSMGVIVYLIASLIGNDILKLVTGLITGLAYYWLVAYLTKSKELLLLHDLLKESYQRIKRKK